MNAPWIDKVLFKIGNVEITVKDVVIGAGGIVGIVLGSVAVCAIISWWKRKQIAEGARRASQAVRRASQSIRNTIRASMANRMAAQHGQATEFEGNKNQMKFLKDLRKDQEQDVNQVGQDPGKMTDIEMSKTHNRGESVGLIPDEVQKEGGQYIRKTFSPVKSSYDSVGNEKSAIKFNNFMADLKKHNKVAPMPSYENVRGVEKVAVMLDEVDNDSQMSEDAVIQSARRGTSESNKKFLELLNQSKQLV